jgi:hypothetical protein
VADGQSKPEAIHEVAQAISQAYEADVFLYNGPINEEGLGALVIESTSLPHTKKRLFLVLVTYGGIGNSAYRIARFAQSFYDEFVVFIPSYCKSAGTLLVLGANKVIMSDFSELGPLDVQLYKRDELFERRSGLVVRSALKSLAEETADLFSHIMMEIKRRSRGLVTFKVASDLAADTATKLLSPIYSQINPVAMGEDFRDLNLAYEYGKRLVEFSGIATEASVRRLVHDYPSHDFVIDKKEAADLFLNLEQPTGDLYRLSSLLGTLAFQPGDKTPIVKSLIEAPQPQPSARDGVIEVPAAPEPAASNEEKHDEGQKAQGKNGPSTPDRPGAGPG